MEIIKSAYNTLRKEMDQSALFLDHFTAIFYSVQQELDKSAAKSRQSASDAMSLSTHTPFLSPSPSPGTPFADPMILTDHVTGEVSISKAAMKALLQAETNEGYFG